MHFWRKTIACTSFTFRASAIVSAHFLAATCSWSSWNLQFLHIKFSWRSLIADNRKISILRDQKQDIGGHRKRQIASRQHHEVEILMVFASFRSAFTLYKAKFLENAVVTSENSWCDVTQSEGGAATGPNWTTAPRLAKKSMTSHESLISHCARICCKKKKKKKMFRIWKKKKHTTHDVHMVNSPYWIEQNFPINIQVCKTQDGKLCQPMFLDPWCMFARNCRIEQISSFKKNLHACIVPEVTAAWPWSRKPRRGVQHCLEQKKQRSTWKGLLQFDENYAVQTTNHKCKHPKLKTRVVNHLRCFYSWSAITHYEIQRLDRHKIEEEMHKPLAWLPKWYFLQFLWIFLAEESKV